MNLIPESTQQKQTGDGEEGDGGEEMVRKLGGSEGLKKIEWGKMVQNFCIT